MDEHIKKHIYEVYNIEVVIEKVQPALQLGAGMYQYGAHLKDDPLTSFSGIYNAKDDSFSELSMNYILFNYKYRQVIRQLFDVENKAVSMNTIINESDADIEYESANLKDLDVKFKNNCEISLHVYGFGSIDWAKYQPIIDYLKEFPNSNYSIVFSIYPATIFNKTDIRANEFSFGYSTGMPDTGFEGRNTTKRLGHFEVFEINLDSLLNKWNEKINEVN